MFCGDVWILITDSMGNILVDTAYGGSYNDGAADLVYHNGYIYVAGQTFSSDYDFSIR